MILVPRPAVRAFARVLRRAVGPRDDPPVTLTADPYHTILRCLAGEALLTYTLSRGSGPGELTVGLSVLDSLAAPGRDNLVFRKAGAARVEVVEWGSVGTTADAVAEPVPWPPFSKSPGAPGIGFLAALAAAGQRTDSVWLRCGRGEVVATDGNAVLAHRGFLLPGDSDLLLPACPAVGFAAIRNQRSVRVGLADGHLVVNAGPWMVALPAATLAFPEPDVAKAGSVEGSGTVPPDDW
jgi:hypothetical protein